MPLSFEIEESLRPAASRFAVVPLGQLRVGVKLRTPIFDAKGESRTLLLNAGRVLTASQIALLRRRGVQEILVDVGEAGRLQSAGETPCVVRKADSPAGVRPAPSPATSGGWTVHEDSFAHELSQPTELKPSSATVTRFEQALQKNVAASHSIFESFRQNKAVDPQEVVRVSVSHLNSICENLDLFVTQGIQPIQKDYPSRHSLQTAMLATSMGTVMGLTKSELFDLSFGCLLHDAGMTFLPEHLITARGELSWSDQIEFCKHPTYTANILNRLHAVSHPAKMVAYQIHERMDGTGYPKQRSGNQIHVLARIAMVADTYLTLVSSCSREAPLKPYEAMEQILQSCRKGEFDAPPVRALLHTTSLFPVGSAIRLSDGRVGRVLRSNREQYARPYIETIDTTSGEPLLEIINLAEHPELTIAEVGHALPLFE